MSGYTNCLGTICQGVRVVFRPNVQVDQMSGCTKCHGCTKCPVTVWNTCKKYSRSTFSIKVQIPNQHYLCNGISVPLPNLNSCWEHETFGGPELKKPLKIKYPVPTMPKHRTAQLKHAFLKFLWKYHEHETCFITFTGHQFVSLKMITFEKIFWMSAVCFWRWIFEGTLNCHQQTRLIYPLINVIKWESL